MNDQQKTPAEGDPQLDDTTQTVEQATHEQPAAEPSPAPAAAASRTRNTLIAGGAGLALVGGLVGFGIGHATADGGDGDRFRPVGQHVRGEGRPGLGDGDRRGGHDDRGGHGNSPGRPPTGDDNPT